MIGNKLIKTLDEFAEAKEHLIDSDIKQSLLGDTDLSKMKLGLAIGMKKNLLTNLNKNLAAQIQKI